MGESTDSAVILITGIIAAGKSTVAQLLAERLPRSVHLRGDVYRRMIVSGRRDPTPSSGDEGTAQLRLRHRATAATADLYAAAGWSVVVQDIVLGDHLDELLAAIRTRPLHLVVLAPAPEAIAAREAGRAKTGYVHWTVEQLDHELRHGTPHRGLWLDTSTHTPAETVDTLLARLPEARIHP